MVIPVLRRIYWQKMGEILCRMPRMSESFAPHGSLVLVIVTTGLEVEVEEFDWLRAICCEEKRSFFRRQVKELQQSNQHASA